jgi:predicted DNA-binding protein (MmcQ/YjbR family)
MTMDIDAVRAFCLSLPHVTEGVQWQSDLLFRIAGKMFAVMNLEPPHTLAFKCTPEKFNELIELEDVVPAPYMARNKWVMLKQLDAINDRELKSLIRESYQMIFSKLPKKTQTELSSIAGSARKSKLPKGS